RPQRSPRSRARGAAPARILRSGSQTSWCTSLDIGLLQPGVDDLGEARELGGAQARERSQLARIQFHSVVDQLLQGSVRVFDELVAKSFVRRQESDDAFHVE